MTANNLDEAIKVGMTVRTTDGVELGTVGDVWTDVGIGESWGAAGSLPQTGASEADSDQYGFSEAMPGEGDNYLRARQPDGEDLYIPFSAVEQVDADVVCLAIDGDTVPGMQWDVKPDFVNVTSEPDSQGGSNKA